jgi:hypothetical protein
MTTRNHQKLRGIVDHVLDKWDQALERWIYLRSFGQSAELSKALSPSYAAHVHNALLDALVFDSLREIGALILDKGEESASLHHATRLIKSGGVLAAIRQDYEIVSPVRNLNKDLEPELLAEINAHMYRQGLERNRREFDELHAKVNKIDGELFASPVTKKIRRARNKAVAHYDFKNAGVNWKAVTIGDAGLTFGDMDAYFESCTNAVKVVTLFVHRKSMDYNASRTIYEKRVAEYIDAMVRGRGAQKAEVEERRKRIVAD